MKLDLTIPASALAASVHCAATKDVRFCIIGVCVTVSADGATVELASTDGNIMSVFRPTMPEPASLDATCEKPTRFVIPLHAAKAAAKSAGKKSPGVKIAFDTESLHGSAGDHLFRAIDGVYPDYSRVIPSAVTGEPADFDPGLLVRGQKALNDFYGAKLNPRLQTNGKGPAVQHFGKGDALVVVMPLRYVRQPGATVNGIPHYSGFSAC